MARKRKEPRLADLLKDPRFRAGYEYAQRQVLRLFGADAKAIARWEKSLDDLQATAERLDL